MNERNENKEKLFQCVLEGILLQNEKGEVTKFNQPCLEIMGLTAEQLKDPEWIRNNLETLKEDGNPFPREQHPSSITFRTGVSVRGVIMGVRNKTNQELIWLKINSTLFKRPGANEVATTFQDITSLKQRDEKRLRALRVSEIHNKILAISTTTETLKNKLSQALSTILNIDWLSIKKSGGFFLKMEDTDVLKLTVSKGMAPELGKICSKVAFGHCLCGRAALEQKTIYAGCVDERHENRFSGMTGHGHYSLPIFFGAELLGVSVLYLEEGHERDEEEVKVLENIMKSVGGMIVNSRISEELEKQKKLAYNQSKLASIGQLAGGVGHEINNPLFVAKGHLRALRKLSDKYPTIKELEELSNKIEKPLDRITNIVKGLRTFSKADSTNEKEFDILPVLSDSIDLVSKIYLKEGLSIILNQSSHHGKFMAHGNPARLQQAFLCLLSNARDATEGLPTKVLKINIGLQERNMTIEFVDSGCGIPRTNIEKIFDPFFTTKEVNKGTGIGLAIVLNHLKEMNGKVEVESQPGAGTRMKVTLPVHFIEKDPSQQAPIIAPELERETPLLSGRVLLADDENEVIKQLSASLEDLGLKVTAVTDGMYAYDLFYKNPENFDLIISDMKMPNLDGLGLVGLIRNDKRLINQPKIVLITGGINIAANENENENELLKMVDGYAFKPFSEKQFRQVVTKVLAS